MYFFYLIQEAIATAKKYTDDRIAEVAPIGSIICVASRNYNYLKIGRGYLRMDGAILSTTSSYSVIRNMLGHNYGEPSSTTTNVYLPNMERDHVFLGSRNKTALNTQTCYNDWSVPELNIKYCDSVTASWLKTQAQIKNSDRCSGITVTYKYLKDNTNYQGHIDNLNDLYPRHYECCYLIKVLK